jgi:hypothetical protein
MSIENSEARKVEPTHPGEMLLEDFMPDYRLTAASLAEALRVSRQTVNELLRGQRGVYALGLNNVTFQLIPGIEGTVITFH